MNCIGGVKDQKIKCYIRKDKEAIKYNRDRFEPVGAGKIHHITTKKGYEIIKAKIRDRNYARDKLRDYYFNIVDVVQ